MRDNLKTRLETALADQYEIQREVGRGGMGIVFRALDLRLRRTVAIKLLPPELAFRDDIRSRFLREAVSAAQLTHPSIVPIFSVDERDGLVYFVMGFVDGENIASILAREGALPPERVRAVLTQVADALGYAHERGVIHRDIKPDNIILDHETQRAMVTDFGIARAVSDTSTRLTATGVAIGTPAYMSPEQCAGDSEIDGRSDLYSLGVVGYQMLAGRPPFEASSTPAMLMKHFTEAPPDLQSVRQGIPSGIAVVVMQLLEKKPEDRFGSGKDVVAALAAGDAYTAKQPPRDQRFAPAAPGRAQAERKSERAAAQPNTGKGIEPPAWKKNKKLKWRDRPLIDRIRSVRNETMQSVGSTFFLFGINMFTSSRFMWWVFPAIGMGWGVWEKVSKLLAEGLTLSDIYGDGAKRILSGESPALAGKQPASQADPAERFAPREVLQGEYGQLVRQAVADNQSIQAQIARLSPADRKVVPELEGTARELLERVTTLAAALSTLDSDVDSSKIRVLDERVAEAERELAGGADVERKLMLLRRQQSSLRDLVGSRAAMHARLESAALMLQNLSLDVIKLRSSGIGSVANDVNSATQEARALIREIGHAVGAADEIRNLESKSRRDST